MIRGEYRPEPDHFDELVDADDKIRAHWQPLIDSLQHETALQAKRRAEIIDQQILDNGVTYNVYADPKGADRLWELDSLPNIIDSAEWSGIAVGVAQRANLLNHVLTDLYGPQQLLRDGLLPPELVHGHSHFLWPAHGVKAPEDIHLHIYGCDLARAPDGRWWVLADRTQTPSGAGYAIENRDILARAYSGGLDRLGVQSLDGYFQRLSDHLLRLAGAEKGSASLVLLTPGALNETYFEHAFLAHELGIPLVEANDLTVRDSTLWLKTLDGLKRVHAVIRRVEGGWCDPLELRSHSALGVPGLLDVARAGRVLIANSLGSGVVESPALMGFLPAICERILGESLQLPSLATWWCGERPVAEQALAKLNDLVFKPSFPLQRFEPVFAADLDRAGQRALRGRIERRGYAYVAQERIKLSTTPVMLDRCGSALGPRAMVMRVFALATDTGFEVIPGGLTRVAGQLDAEVVSMQRGGRSKDTWVLGALPVGDELPQTTIAAPSRVDLQVLSRTLENLFWLGRNSERCDAHLRVLRSMLKQMRGSSPVLAKSSRRIAEAVHMLPAAKTHTAKSFAAAVISAITDEAWSGSLRQCLNNLVGSATEVRAVLSKDNWRTVRELKQVNAELAAKTDTDAMLMVLNRLAVALAAMTGFALGGMTRDRGRQFLIAGRSLEYLYQHSLLLAKALSGRRIDTETLGWLLELSRSTITFRRRYQSAPQLAATLDLITVDASNPHSIRCHMDILLDALVALDCGPELADPLRQARDRLLRLDCFAGSAATQLAAYFIALNGCLLDVGERLTHAYFVHVRPAARSTYFA